jgi:hypothetical protein
MLLYFLWKYCSKQEPTHRSGHYDGYVFILNRRSQWLYAMYPPKTCPFCQNHFSTSTKAHLSTASLHPVRTIYCFKPRACVSQGFIHWRYLFMSFAVPTAVRRLQSSGMWGCVGGQMVLVFRRKLPHYLGEMRWRLNSEPPYLTKKNLMNKLTA